MVRRSSQSKSTSVSSVAEYSPIGMCTSPNVMAPFHSERVEDLAMPFVSAIEICVRMFRRVCKYGRANAVGHAPRVLWALAPCPSEGSSEKQAEQARQYGGRLGVELLRVRLPTN